MSFHAYVYDHQNYELITLTRTCEASGNELIAGIAETVVAVWRVNTYLFTTAVISHAFVYNGDCTRNRITSRQITYVITCDVCTTHIWHVEKYRLRLSCSIPLCEAVINLYCNCNINLYQTTAFILQNSQFPRRKFTTDHGNKTEKTDWPVPGGPAGPVAPTGPGGPMIASPTTYATHISVKHL